MSDKKLYDLGILAFGSLIDNPGKEISKIEINRIDCKTPFNVEFARKSSTRNDAPTLIPVEQGGKKVKATIIVLRDDTNIETAKSILWRREIHRVGRKDNYTHSETPSINKVVVKISEVSPRISKVLYTSIRRNIEEELTSELLAELAIKSILSEAGQKEKDGVRYLLSAKRNGIITELSNDYENQILAKTETKTLEEAIEKLDRQRLFYPKK